VLLSFCIFGGLVLPETSILSDDFVRELINVGEVDIVVGVPTHNNGRTVGQVVQAVRAGRARTGLLLQDPQAQTVLARSGDDVAFGLENHAVPFDQIWLRVEQALPGEDEIVRRDTIIESRVAIQVCHKLNVKAPSIEVKTGNLSGGNQQKVVLAKWLSLDPKVLIFDEPTRGIDVGAKAEVQRLIAELAEKGFVRSQDLALQEVVSVSVRHNDGERGQAAQTGQPGQ